MKLYVNTENLDANAKALSSLQSYLTTEKSKIKNILRNLQGQSVPLDDLYRTINTICEIENEIDLLVSKLKKIKNIYDDTETEVLRKIQLLPGNLSIQKLPHSIVLYGLNDMIVSQKTFSYMNFFPQVPYAVTHKLTSFRMLFIKQNIKELPKVINQIFDLPGEETEDWLLEKLINWFHEWTLENIHFSTGCIPMEIKQIDASDLFKDN